MIFSSYFIAGYFFSVKPFQETPNIIANLDIVFFRDISLEDAMAYIRSNNLFNQSLSALEDPS